MARYLVFGTIYYSSSTNRTNARNAMQAVVDSDVGVNAEAVGSYPAGINNTGTNGLNIGLSCDSENTAENFRSSFLSAWAGYPRSSTASHIGIVREGN